MPPDASRHHGIKLEAFASCEVMLEIARCLSTWQFNALHRLHRKGCWESQWESRAHTGLQKREPWRGENTILFYFHLDKTCLNTADGLCALASSCFSTGSVPLCFQMDRLSRFQDTAPVALKTWPPVHVLLQRWWHVKGNHIWHSCDIDVPDVCPCEKKLLPKTSGKRPFVTSGRCLHLQTLQSKLPLSSLSLFCVND